MIVSSLNKNTRNRRTKGKSKQLRKYKFEDKTRIKELRQNSYQGVDYIFEQHCKYLLTIYLADKLIQLSTVPITAITRLLMTLQNNREEANKLIVLCAAEIHSKSVNIHLYSSDIDVPVLVLYSLPLLERHTVMIIRTGLKNGGIFLACQL